MTVGQKIKYARSLRGITQKELGARIGLPDVRIRQYEIEARTPKQGIIKDIADALGVSCDFFTDHYIESPADIMHILFELEDSMGVILREDRDDHGEMRYSISFGDETMNACLETWYNHKNAKLDDVNNYHLWQARFQESK